MPEDLQSLLDKINSEGIKKAEEEKAKIIAAAKAEAEQIVSNANSEAAKIIADANKDVAAINTRTVSALRQAARDIALQLKEELQKRLANATQEATAAAFSADFMASLIKELAVKFASDPDAQITVRTALKDVNALDAALKSALADSFSKEPVLFGAGEISGGMEVDFKDGKCFFDFSADAVAELMNNYIGEQLSAIFKAD